MILLAVRPGCVGRELHGDGSRSVWGEGCSCIWEELLGCVPVGSSLSETFFS